MSHEFHISLVAEQTRLSEWADLIRDYQKPPARNENDEEGQLHDITKLLVEISEAREAYLETADAKYL